MATRSTFIFGRVIPCASPYTAQEAETISWASKPREPSNGSRVPGAAARWWTQRRARPLGGEAGEAGLTTAARCYSLAASAPYRQGLRLLHDLLSKICDTTKILHYYRKAEAQAQ
jgi:hypothetical protein